MRPRNPKNRNLPRNCYCKDGYYSYQHPDTGVRYGLGRDSTVAINDAKVLNEKLISNSTRVDKILAGVKSSNIVNYYIDAIVKRWEERVAKNEMAKSTLKKNMTYIPAIRAAFGPMMPAAVRTLHFEEFLTPFSVNARQTVRSVLNTLWTDVVRLEELDFNAVERTTIVIPEVARKRLTFTLYKAIREQAPVWCQNAFDLMLHTAMRPVDLVNLKWRYIHVEDGKTFLYTRPSKTKRKTNVGQRMECSPPVLKTLETCRDSVVSEYVLHFPYRPGRFNRFTGKPLDPKYLSHQFEFAREAVFKEHPELFMCPDEASEDHDRTRPMRENEHPTLYEIRSLASYMYEEAQKHDKSPDKRKVANILGHADERTTEENYLSRHPIRWVDVVIGHDL